MNDTKSRSLKSASDGSDVNVYLRSDDGVPLASAPVCNGCSTTDFPEEHVSEEGEKLVSAVHVCSECGTLSATEIPQWKRLGESHVVVAGTSYGWVALDERTREIGGPMDDKWDALGVLGYSQEDVKALFEQGGSDVR